MCPEKPHPIAKEKKLVAVVLFFFAALTAVRVLNILSMTPEYDELWSVQHYLELSVPDVFLDVATPNNHVLNTLGIKFFSHLIPNRNLAMRMTALLGFCALCAILFRAVTLMMRDNAARGMVLAVILLDGLLLHYAETARGYSLQTFFVFGMFLSLFRYSDGPPGNRTCNAWMWFCCALGCCLSVSSGVVYVAVLTGLWGALHVPFRSGSKSVLAFCRPLTPAGVCWSLLALAWYGINFSRFARGRAEFGETFGSVFQYLTYCVRALLDLRIIWTLPCLAAGLFLFRGRPAWRFCAFGLGAVALMLASALLTRGGPARIYLPLVPVAVFCTGVLPDELLRSNPRLKRAGIWLFLLVFALSACFSEGRRKKAAAPDLVEVFAEVSKLDPGIFAAYHPLDSYVMLMLFEDALCKDNLERMESPRMLLVLHENAVAVVPLGGTDVEMLPLSARPASSGSMLREQDFPFWLYRLRPFRAGDDPSGKTVLCFASLPLPEETADRIAGKFAFVNGMLTRSSSRQCLAASGDALTADELTELMQSCPGQLSFQFVEAGTGAE